MLFVFQNELLVILCGLFFLWVGTRCSFACMFDHEVNNKYGTVKTLVQNYMFIPWKHKQTYFCSLLLHYKAFAIWQPSCSALVCATLKWMTFDPRFARHLQRFCASGRQFIVGLYILSCAEPHIVDHGKISGIAIIWFVSLFFKWIKSTVECIHS